MAFSITHRMGAMRRGEAPVAAAVDGLLDELDLVDDEHPGVALSHESGWTLSAYPGGLVVYEDVEADDVPRHLADVERIEVARLMRALAAGDLALVEDQPWQPGYG